MHSFSNLRKAAFHAYIDSKKKKRRIALTRAGLMSIALLLVIGGLIFAASAFASSAAVLPSILDLERLGLIGSLDSNNPSDPSGSWTAAPLAKPVSVGTLALPSPIPSATSTLGPTATLFLPDTLTPTSTITATPTITPTPSETSTPSATPTPSQTPLGGPAPSSTFSATPPPTARAFPGCSPSGSTNFESTLLTLINSERESQGLPAYDQQTQLQAAARIHSTDMACNGFFSHVGSDGSNKEDRVSAQGYGGISVGENILGTGDTSSGAPQLAFEYWMASPQNQANILHEEYTDIGIGYIYEPSSPFGSYFTAVFALP